MKNFVITIARGFGSNGKQVAIRVAQKLGIPCYEHRILTLASEYSGFPENAFEDEKLKGPYWATRLLQLPTARGPIPETEGFISNRRLFEVQKHIINDLADTESCVIVGKCADDILKDRDNVISIYIDAERGYCIEQIMDRMPGVTADEANDMIVKTDRYRAEYYKCYTGRVWDNVVNYDLFLNTSRTGVDLAVDLIIDYLHKKLGEENEEC